MASFTEKELREHLDEVRARMKARDCDAGELSALDEAFEEAA